MDKEKVYIKSKDLDVGYDYSFNISAKEAEHLLKNKDKEIIILNEFYITNSGNIFFIKSINGNGGLACLNKNEVIKMIRLQLT
jgi:hypothetical protein